MHSLLSRCAEAVAWLVAASWVFKAIEAALGLPRVANLLDAGYDAAPEGSPALTVIVPARNEDGAIEACLRSLLAQDYPHLQIIAVDDRSTDATGRMMDELALAYPQLLRVLHVTELPADWLGKTHAMGLAATHAAVHDQTDWLLFTDGDILFRMDALRRSLVYAVASGADHLVTVPTTIIKRWDEGALLGFFQIFGLWGSRAWKVPDPKAKRDSIGIGAFNLVRRAAYEQVGGFAALRMEVVEDISFGHRIKRAGLRQRAAFGRGLVEVHWAAGASGLVGVMTKNIFSAFRFSIWWTLAGCLWLAVFSVTPAVELLGAGTRVPAAITLLAVCWVYRLYGRITGISAWQALLSPMAAMVFIFMLLRSMVVTLRQGGVIWRGTFYSLATLRQYVRASRLEAGLEAEKMRARSGDT